MYRHRLLPHLLIPIVAGVLPGLEIVVAFSVVFGTYPVITATIVLMLFLVFLVTEVTLVVTKRATDCGCYGVAYPQKVDRASIVVSTILVSSAALHLRLVTSVDPIIITVRWPVIAVSVAVGIMLAWRVVLEPALTNKRLHVGEKLQLKQGGKL